MKKKNLVYLLIIPLFVACGVSKEKKDAALVYNNKLVGYYAIASTSLDEMTNQLTSLVTSSINGSLDSLDLAETYKTVDVMIEEIDLYIDTLNSMPEFDEDINYKQAVTDALIDCQMLLGNEYQDVLRFLQGEFTEDKVIKFSESMLIILRRIIDSHKATSAVQKEFAKKYTLDIPDNSSDINLMELQYEQYKSQVDKMSNPSVPDEVIY